MEKVGGRGGLQQTPRPERERVAAIFVILIFLFFSFCHNNDYIPEILET